MTSPNDFKIPDDRINCFLILKEMLFQQGANHRSMGILCQKHWFQGAAELDEHYRLT